MRGEPAKGRVLRALLAHQLQVAAEDPLQDDLPDPERELQRRDARQMADFRGGELDRVVAHPDVVGAAIGELLSRASAARGGDDPLGAHQHLRILSGKKVYTGLLTIPLDLLISPIALGYYIGGRFFLSKTFMANNNCNNCGICIRECPTSSIKLVSGRPYWKLTCESCMRCLNLCPNKAIEAAHGMAAAFWIIFSAINTQLILLVINALNINPDIWWWKLTSRITGIVCMILVTAVLYRIMHYAMGFKPIRYLVRFTSLTALPFWRRYSFLKNRKKNDLSADDGMST